MPLVHQFLRPCVWDEHEQCIDPRRPYRFLQPEQRGIYSLLVKRYDIVLGEKTRYVQLACDCTSTEHGPRPLDSRLSFDLLLPPLSFVDRLQLLEERIDYKRNDNIVEDNDSKNMKTKEEQPNPFCAGDKLESDFTFCPTERRKGGQKSSAPSRSKGMFFDTYLFTTKRLNKTLIPLIISLKLLAQ